MDERRHVGPASIKHHRDCESFHVGDDSNVDRSRHGATVDAECQQGEETDEQCDTPYLRRPHVIARLSAEFVQIERISDHLQGAEHAEAPGVLRNDRWMQVPGSECGGDVEHRIRHAVQSPKSCRGDLEAPGDDAVEHIGEERREQTEAETGTAGEPHRKRDDDRREKCTSTVSASGTLFRLGTNSPYGPVINNSICAAVPPDDGMPIRRPAQI